MTLLDGMTEREAITRAELARRLSVSKSAVTQACARQRLGAAQRADGKIWWPDACRYWHGNRDPQAELAEDEDGPADDDVEVASVPSGRRGYRDERTETERVRRQLLQMQLDEKMGRLVDAEAVSSAQQTAARRLRDRIGREVERWSGPLASLTGHDEAALRAFLRRRASDLQAALAETMTTLDDQARDDENGEAVFDAT